MRLSGNGRSHRMSLRSGPPDRWSYLDAKWDQPHRARVRKRSCCDTGRWVAVEGIGQGRRVFSEVVAEINVSLIGIATEL
jgi:hypothetical protein